MVIKMNKTQKNIIKFTIYLSSLLLFSPLIAQSQQKNKPLNASQIVQNVQEYYEGIEDYEARFVQTTAHKMFPGRLQRAYGTLMFKKGGLMRWEYRRPENKLFIYDNKLLWAYEPEVPQIFKGSDSTDRLRKALAFLTGEGKITASYKVKQDSIKKYDFKNGYILILTPKEKNSPFSHVELYVNQKDFSVARSVVVDHEGNRNRLDFYEPKLNQKLNPGLFNFVPPKGVPIVTH
jgi:outer membrane lipoprotein carrier protein